MNGARAAAAAQRDKPLTTAGRLLVGLWIITLYDPQWFLASFGLTPLLRVPTLLFFGLIVMLLFEVPGRAAWRQRWTWYLPMVLFIATAVVTLPFAMNTGFARNSITQFLLFWVLIVGTVVVVDTPRRAEQLFLLYGMSFVWFGVWGSWRGGVPWHYSLFNEDGFGALMCVGIGMCAFTTVAAPRGSRYRKWMTIATALCIIGVVASFARGAFLASCIVGFMVWIRSRNKMRALALGLAGGVLVLIAANLLHPGEFWAEIQSAFSEGTESGTGEDRWILWGAAWEVFKERPIFGVGPRNFGPFAAQFFQVGDLAAGGYGYTTNPGMLYNRSLHNVYVQILSEHGLVGSFAFLWALVDFWRRNMALRTRKARALWQAAGGWLDLRSLALGLEAAMVGFMINAMFYALVNVHWLYSLLAMNLLLHTVVFTRARRRRRGQQFVAGPAQGFQPAASFQPAPAFQPAPPPAPGA